MAPDIHHPTSPGLRADSRAVDIPLHQPGRPFRGRSISSRVDCYQLISELDITGGDERKVGYYAGLIVRDVLSCVGRGLLTFGRRNRYFLSRKLLLFYNGVAFQTTSVANQSY